MSKTAVKALANQIKQDDAERKAKAKARREAKKANAHADAIAAADREIAAAAQQGTDTTGWTVDPKTAKIVKPRAAPTIEQVEAKRLTAQAAYEAALRVDAKAILGEDASEEAIAKYIAEQTTVETKGHYDGPMLALRKAAKHYVKGANGNPHCGDWLANALDGLTREQVVDRLGRLLFKLGVTDSVNPYIALNPGQQSMNLRNKARGAYIKGLLNDADLATLKAE